MFNKIDYLRYATIKKVNFTLSTQSMNGKIENKLNTTHAESLAGSN